MDPVTNLVHSVLIVDGEPVAEGKVMLKMAPGRLVEAALFADSVRPRGGRSVEEVAALIQAGELSAQCGPSDQVAFMGALNPERIGRDC